MSRIFQFGDYVLETPELVLKKGSEILKLSSRQIETLALIVEASGRPVPKQVFFEQVWVGAFVEESNLTQTIFMLRRVLGKLPDGGDYIETLPRHGYRLSARAGFCLKGEALASTSGDGYPHPDLPIELENTMKAEQLSPEISLSQEGSSTVPGEQTGWPHQDIGSHVGQAVGQTGRRPRYRRIAAAALVLLAAGIPAFVLLVQPSRVTIRHSTRITNDGAYKEVLAPLLSDGTRIFFTEIIGNTNYLAEVSALGGIVTRHPMPSPEASAAALSSAHEGLLFDSTWDSAESRSLTLQSTANGAARRIGHFHAHSAAWSPDGQQIAFTVGHDLLVCDHTGASLHRIAELPDVPFWPSWSPNGAKIRFSRMGGGLRQSLWEVPAAGGRLSPVLAGSPHAYSSCCGSWSPDGRFFIYSVDEGHSSSIWMKREAFDLHLPGGSRDTLLVEGPIDFWRSPLISPDGRHLFAVGEQARGELVEYDPGRHGFVPALPGLSADTLSFSRDGQWMAYTLFPEGTLWRSRVDGSEKLQLSEPGQLARFPQWAPDGRSIAYIATAPGQVCTVHSVSSDGGPSRVLLNDASSQGVATFSPDGRRVAFGRTAAYGAIPGAAQGITIVDLANAHAETLPGSENLWTARWSPSGEYIAASTLDRQKLMLFELRTGQWSELASLGVNDIVWGRDGKELFFDTPNGAHAAIYQVDMKTRAVSELTNLTAMQRTGFYGWSLGISAANRILILRQTGFVELYRFDVDSR